MTQGPLNERAMAEFQVQVEAMADGRTPPTEDLPQRGRVTEGTVHTRTHTMKI